MGETFGFWFWLVLMLFIVSVIGSIGALVWRSDRRGRNGPELDSPPAPEPSRGDKRRG